MTKIGEKLRATRMERGVTLQEISDETKISPRYLEAVENGDATGLPGAVFARNFTRQYAVFLGLSSLGLKPVDLDEQIRMAFPPEVDPHISVAPGSILNASAATPAAEIKVEPIADAWNWKRLAVSAVALVAVLGAGAAIYWVAQSAPALLESARQEAREESGAQRQQVSNVSANSNMPKVEVSQTTAPGSDEVSETTITISGSGMAVRLVAEQDTWVSMTANGEHVFSEVIRANESRTISGVERARMVVGNAGGLKIATNGKDIGPIGLPGQVRVVLLSPDGPQIARQPI